LALLAGLGLSTEQWMKERLGGYDTMTVAGSKAYGSDHTSFGGPNSSHGG
jgi:hypothetical protein